MPATSPNIRRWCLHCGEPFKAQRSSAQFCSEAHKKAHQREAYRPSPEPDDDAPVIASAERPGLLDRLMRKYDIPIPKVIGRLGWTRPDAITHMLQIGSKAVGHVINKHPSEKGSSWHAVHREKPYALCDPVTVVGPATIQDLGISRATLADAKKVTEALATGDFRHLILDAWDDEDNTDDVVLTMKNLPRLLRESLSPIPVAGKHETEEPTEDFNTEERLIVRLTNDWVLVQGDDCWILQQRIGDRWQQAGRFRSRTALVHAVGMLVGDVDAEALAIIDALP